MWFTAQKGNQINYLDHDIEHGSWITDGHLWLLLIGGFYDKVLRKGVGKNTPDTISVQLQRPPKEEEDKLINQLQ